MPNTTTGYWYEDRIKDMVLRNYTSAKTQNRICRSPKGTEYKADITIGGGQQSLFGDNVDPGVIISIKYQETSGSAEDKIYYEAIALRKALMSRPDFQRAYIIMEGRGFSPRAKPCLKEFLDEDIFSGFDIRVVSGTELEELLNAKQI